MWSNLPRRPATKLLPCPTSPRVPSFGKRRGHSSGPKPSGGGGEDSAVRTARTCEPQLLCLDALWLKASDDGDDWIIPVPPVPATFRSEPAYTRAQFEQLLRQPAEEALTFDRAETKVLTERGAADPKQRPASGSAAHPTLEAIKDVHERYLVHIRSARMRLAGLILFGILAVAGGLGVYREWFDRTEIITGRITLEAETKLGVAGSAYRTRARWRYHVPAGQPFAVRIESHAQGIRDDCANRSRDRCNLSSAGPTGLCCRSGNTRAYPSLPSPVDDTLLLIVVTPQPFAESLRQELGEDLSRPPEARGCATRLERMLKNSRQKWAVVLEARLMPQK